MQHKRALRILQLWWFDTKFVVFMGVGVDLTRDVDKKFLMWVELNTILGYERMLMTIEEQCLLHDQGYIN